MILAWKGFSKDEDGPDSIGDVTNVRTNHKTSKGIYVKVDRLRDGMCFVSL